MKKIESVQDFREFLAAHRDRFIEQAVNIRDLSADDDWIQDDEWEEIYRQEVSANAKL